ncbi:MAG: hypothetical protein NT173_02485 [Opitutales bacterium]|nr:hypothetical protein [Opitutales bacterium]
MDLQAAREAVWLKKRDQLLCSGNCTAAELKSVSKNASSKLAVTTGLKAATTVTNRWLAENHRRGNMYEVSRNVSAWSKYPDPSLLRLIS